MERTKGLLSSSTTPSVGSTVRVAQPEESSPSSASMLSTRLSSCAVALSVSVSSVLGMEGVSSSSLHAVNDRPPASSRVQGSRRMSVWVFIVKGCS